MSDLGATRRDPVARLDRGSRDALDVDASLVDVKTIHGLTKRIAHGYDRPMAPVGAFILGLAVGGREGADVGALRAVLESTIHGRHEEEA